MMTKNDWWQRVLMLPICIVMAFGCGDGAEEGSGGGKDGGADGAAGDAADMPAATDARLDRPVDAIEMGTDSGIDSSNGETGGSDSIADGGALCSGSGVLTGIGPSGVCPTGVHPIVGRVETSAVGLAHDGLPACAGFLKPDGLAMASDTVSGVRVDSTNWTASGDGELRYVTTIVGRLSGSSGGCGVQISVHMATNWRVEIPSGTVLGYAMHWYAFETAPKRTTVLRDGSGKLLVAFTGGNTLSFWDKNLVPELDIEFASAPICATPGGSLLRATLRAGGDSCTVDSLTRACCALGGAEYSVAGVASRGSGGDSGYFDISAPGVLVPGQ
jgi:hypothetical protein